ncbi:trace amine-associated receptor 13c [Oncorhynchus tshawytscha]|uniref:G-protein coupled receptors family 1 profile domain-containing protein n=1 Tax=Oncorhynchus tshawytscha TaxID=74940 RepID=A0AAZ3PXC6_ONCTS|nr:trace amine-associated receptor 13c [Oncorhynchus tshawytscha]
MEELEDVQYCFQDRNSSCRKALPLTSIHSAIYLFISVISAVTVFLNILVIISISHFKQLHTPTNLLILSLAVSDLLVGLIALPVTTVAIMESCWGFGEYFCVFQFYITCLCTSLSLGNLVLISIDRYVAVCDPLLYHSKITITRTMCSISINWCCCIIHDAAIIKNFVNVQVPSRCLKECFILEGFNWVNFISLVLKMVVPCALIITLYLKIFVVARSQARKVFSKEAGVQTVQENKSERKATKTLSIVVFNYLICWTPSPVSFFLSFFGENVSSSIICFLPLVNSLINPIIYAFFYPWFKLTAKLIITLKFRRS